MTQTDKMLSRKEGGVGYLIFNNPERHNAVSLEMWDAASGILADFAADNAIRVVVLTGAGGKAFVSGADISKFESERSSKDAIDRYNAAVDQGEHGGLRISQADHCDDPRLLHRRRCRPRAVLRPAHLLGQFQIRRACGETRPRLRLQGHQEAGRCRRARHSPRRSFSPRASSPPRKLCRWAWSTAFCPMRRSRNM